MKIKINQIFTLLAIVCFVLLTRNLFILRFVQPVGYVVDIYSMFPLSFYLAFMFCYLVATFLVLNGKKVLGTLILCINHFEILIIPYMLGYYSMGRADDMSYIGEYLQIATSGHFADWDIYPASHIIGASISLISNLEAHSTFFIMPIVFSFIFIAGIYLFSRELFPDPCIHSLVLVASFILYLGTYNFLNVPHALFFALMPLYLFCLYKYIKKYNNISMSILFVLITLFIPFTHPFIVFFLFAVFLFHMLPTILSTSNLEVLRIPKIKVSSLLLLVIPFMGWFIYNNTLLGSFKSNYISYIKKITEPVFVETTGKLTKINFVVSDYIQLISFFYGRYIIPTLLILASFIFIYLNKDIIKRKCLKNYPYLVVLSVVLFFVQIILLFTPIISHQPDRIMNLNFVVYAQVPLFACALYLLFLEKSQSNSRILLVCGILLLVWSLSLFGCFDSPNVYRTNVALTQNEVSGMNWFYKVKDKSIIGTPFSQIERFNYLFGNFQAVDIIYHFPDHFGYANNSSNLADINLQEVQKLNIIILTIDELLYQEVPGYKTVGRYTKEDFNRFKTDSSVIKIFDSTNIEIFRSYHEVNS